MFKLTKTEIRNVAVKDAENFISMNTFENQRALRDRHVHMLSQSIKDGTFHVGNFAIARMHYNGEKTQLMNGQHQAHAIIEAKKPIKATVAYFDVDSPEDTSLLYRQFDNHATRSLSDILKPEAAALGVGWNVRVVNLVVTAAALREGKRAAHKNTKVELLSKYLPFGKFLNELIVNGSTIDIRHLVRGPVVHAMILSWEKSQEDAKKFWTAVRDGENLTRSMPAHKLRGYLLSVSVNQGRGATGASFKIASYHEITSKSITAWNAYRRGESTELKYYSDKPMPKAV